MTPSYEQLVSMYQQQLQAAAAAGQHNPYSSISSSLNVSSAPHTGFGLGGSYSYGTSAASGSFPSNLPGGSNAGAPSYSTYR